MPFIKYAFSIEYNHWPGQKRYKLLYILTLALTLSVDEEKTGYESSSIDWIIKIKT